MVVWAKCFPAVISGYFTYKTESACSENRKKLFENCDHLSNDTFGEAHKQINRKNNYAALCLMASCATLVAEGPIPVAISVLGTLGAAFTCARAQCEDHRFRYYA